MRALHRSLAIALAVAGLVSSAHAQASKKYGDLLKRLPETANALLLVDLDGLFNSKLGQREQWRQRSLDDKQGGLVQIGDATKLVAAAHLEFPSMEETWKLGMAEMRQPVDLATLAKQESGYVETLVDTPVAWTPRNLFLLSFPPKILGFASPANRQAISRSLQQTMLKPRMFPPGFADRAIYHADRESEMVLAFDFANLVSVPLAREWLKDLPSTTKAKIDPEFAAKALATVKSAYLAVDVTDSIRGTLFVEFDGPVSYIRPIAKDVILEALESAGVGLGDLQKWNAETGEKSITLTGSLTRESARRILYLVKPPSLTASGASVRPPDPVAKNAPPPNPQADIIAASQSYYRSVIDLLNGLKGEKSNSSHGMKLWYDRYAQRIDELPLLNVDKDLLDWGSDISRTLRDVSFGANYSAKNQSYRLSNSPSGVAYYGRGYGYAGESKAYDQAVIKRQADAQLSVFIDSRWGTINDTIAAMRRKMVDRYKVDF